MARFIPGYSDQQLPPPYKATGVSLWSFPLVARFDKLQEVVDEYLNIAPPGSVDFVLRPLGALGRAFVYLTVLHYDRLISDVPPFNTQGFHTQNELYFAIPFVRWKGLVPVDIGLFTPYIFVDEPWSLISGNTVAGFPKLEAQFVRLPASPASPYPIEIDAPVFPTYSPATPVTRKRILDVNALLGEPVEKENLWPFGDIDGLFGPEGEVPVEQAVFALLQKIVLSKAYSLIQLKQIRDAVQPDVAVYQAVLNFTVGLDALASLGFLPPAVVDLPAYASLQIAKGLDLIDNGGRYFPILPYWVQLDFSLKDPKVLYSSP